MRVLDLSHSMSNHMPVFPGSPDPDFSDIGQFESDGFREKLLHISSHTGTHLDAPAHMIKNGKTLDEFDTDKFLGNGIVLDVTKFSTGEVPRSAFDNSIQLKNIDFVLIYTGHSKKWGSPEYFENSPFLSPELAELLSLEKIKGIGIDSISVDEISSTQYFSHHKILSKNIIIIENLANLSQLTGKTFTFICLPLKIQHGDGSPVRAVALVS
ncbi:MAG: cyclase family protein [Calditrichaceae bacterium]